MKTLALAMIVKNEERCLARCLDSVRGLVDAIVVADTGSTDKTREIAAGFGASVYGFAWGDDFAAARNFALAQSACDWNLVLDADESLAEGDRGSLQPFLEKGGQIGAVEIRSRFAERGETRSAIALISRLLPGGTGYTGAIHEQVDSPLPRVRAPLAFDHDGYLLPGKAQRNLGILLREAQRYPDDAYYLFQTAHALKGTGDYARADGFYKRFYEKVPADAGYRAKGVVDYIYNLLELKAYEKGLGLIERESGALDLYTDFHFACGVFFMDLVLHDVGRYIAYLPRIASSYQRCLQIGDCVQQQGVVGSGSFLAAYNLGTWYEVSGDNARARDCYARAARDGYGPAEARLKSFAAGAP